MRNCWSERGPSLRIQLVPYSSFQEEEMEMSHFPIAPNSGASHITTYPQAVPELHGSSLRLLGEAPTLETQRGRAPAGPPPARPPPPGTQSQGRARDERCLRWPHPWCGMTSNSRWMESRRQWRLRVALAECERRETRRLPRGWRAVSSRHVPRPRRTSGPVRGYGLFENAAFPDVTLRWFLSFFPPPVGCGRRALLRVRGAAVLTEHAQTPT